MGKGIMALREKQRTLTLDVTGNVAWRRQGIFYKKNELFLDTVEKVSALLTPAGDMLAGEVSGRIPMFTSSGMRVRFLKVFEKSYAPTKWVRYVTASGSYECRI